MKKYKEIAFWIILIGITITCFSFIYQAKAKIPFTSINIKFVDTPTFLNREYILQITKKAKINEKNYIKDLDIDEIEKIIAQNPAVKKNDIYKTINGILYIEITEKKPLARVIDQKQKSYYISKEGELFKTNKNTAYSIIVNGNISEILAKKDIFILLKYIKNDEFLSSFIDQIYINNRYDIELIPKIGNQIIKIGSVHNYKNKLKKLKIFYADGLQYIGWEKYKIIDLRYKNQVVCQKI